MDTADRHQLRTAFDTDAAGYDAGRLPHPGWVFDRLGDLGALGAGSVVLEVGPGTGQATLPMVERGARVTAVELGPNLVERLRAKVAGRPVEVVVGDFESVDLPLGPFDLGFSANAFHWLDPVPALRRMAGELRAGGWLALSWTVFRHPGHRDPFSRAVQPVYEACIGSGRASATPYALQPDLVTADVEVAGGFGPVEVEEEQDEVDFTTDQVVAMFATYSEWAALPGPRRTEALGRIATIAEDQFGGAVTRPRRTVLYRAQRR